MREVGRVKTAITVPGSGDRVVLLHWSADDTPRLRNILRLDAAGAVVWRADLPGHAGHDCFVSLRRDGRHLIARTYTGLEARLTDEGSVAEPELA